LCLLIGTVTAVRLQPNLNTASGVPVEMPANESMRREWFYKVWGGWPPTMHIPSKKPIKERPAWTKYQNNKEAALRVGAKTESRSWQWEQWLEKVQIRAIDSYTEKGWGLDTMPAATHQVINNYFRDAWEDKKFSPEGAKFFGRITGERRMVSLSTAHKILIQDTLIEMIGQWSGIGAENLEPTSTYGIRAYMNESTLKTHVDRCETHILSAVYCVEDSYPKGVDRWPMVADGDFLGERVSVAIPPGKIFYYESSKLMHGRPDVMNGHYSAHVFVHFRPKGWNLVNTDRVYGVPPGWDDPRHPGWDTNGYRTGPRAHHVHDGVEL